MKVLLLGPYPPPHGGVQTNLVAIRNRLRELGHGCAVINLYRHRSARDEEVYHPTSAIETLGLLLKLRYDIVHLHVGGDIPARLVGLALACTVASRAPAVLTLHSGGYASSPAGRSAGPQTLRGFVFRRFDRVIVVNREMEALFLRFGLREERVRLILPHPPPPKPGAELSPVLRDFYAAHSPVLLTVVQLEPEYDIPLQIESLGEVRRRFPNAGLVIAGQGSLERELRERIAAQPWAEHILMPGDVPHAVTLRAMAESDILLRTTLYDGDSVAVREALQLGTPVIATDNGMRPAGVHLIPARDRDALLEAIAACLARPKQAAPAAQEEDNVAAVVELYEELLGNRGARTAPIETAHRIR